MESISLQQVEILSNILIQVRDGILQLKQWTEGVDIKTLPETSRGAQDLAGNVMLLQAICEGIKQVDKRAPKLLSLRPEIPWRHVMSMRDRIAHGYFDIDIDYIDEIITHDLDSLLDAVCALIQILPKISNDQLQEYSPE